jgi:hypothetical protein
MSLSMRRIPRIAVVLGLCLHLSLVIVAGNRLRAPWSGRGDEPIYISLAQNLATGKGYTFAGRPTALRAPAYPVLLSAAIRIFPHDWPLAVRILQFFFVIFSALLCGLLARSWGFPWIWASGAFLVIPTMAYFTGEFLTESLAALVILGYLFSLNRLIRSWRMSDAVAVGILSGIAALVRFNAIPLIGIAVVVMVLFRASWKQAGLAVVCFLLVVSPWLIHNLRAFDGKVLYSTHSWYAAVEGMLSPTGRADPGQSEQVVAAIGWANWLVETNEPENVSLRDEVTLNQTAKRAAIDLWKVKGWKLVPIAARKLSAFWLSTDQLLDLGMVPPRWRLIRRTAVVIYWLFLAGAIAGWEGLRRSHPAVAWALLGYALALTLVHVPLTMNTRLRAPLFDPLIATLAGCWLARRFEPDLRVVGR